MPREFHEQTVLLAPCLSLHTVRLQALGDDVWKVRYVAEVILISDNNELANLKRKVTFGVRSLPHDDAQLDRIDRPGFAMPHTTWITSYGYICRGRYVAKKYSVYDAEYSRQIEIL